MERLLRIATAVSVVAILALLGLLAYFSLPLVTSGRLPSIFSWQWQPFGGHFGILPMLAGSCLLSILATTTAFPAALGICAFLFMERQTGVARLVEVVVHVLTGIPTVIIGFVSVFVLVPLVRDLFGSGTGFSLLTTCLALAFLILPTMVLVLNAHIQQLDSMLRLGTAALGFSPMAQFRHVILPAASRGMQTALILGFCRAAGDAMLPLMLAGNAARFPEGPLDSFRAITAHIALVIATDSQSMAYQSVFAAGLILFFMTALVTMQVRRLNRQFRGEADEIGH